MNKLFLAQSFYCRAKNNYYYDNILCTKSGLRFLNDKISDFILNLCSFNAKTKILLLEINYFPLQAFYYYDNIISFMAKQFVLS